ncbi:MAG TPA: tetratricopeptide repeat protein [Anaerolineales bacterium]|nr:tetratricopeptide repeat protein [Anaerolineales bacterium]
MAEEPEPVNTMFEDAVDALRLGERARGKEILTRLLKTDQNNSNYWIWMSAAVDTAKERIYCLETALKLDPQNAIAKRGLVLLGGIQPDEDVQPFPLNRPRAWENDLLLAHEKPEEKAGGLRSPLARVVIVVLAAALVMAVVSYALLSTRGTAIFRPAATRTAGPTAPFTLTPTFVNATEPPRSTQIGPTPLAALLGISYTPTPLAVLTPRSPLSADYYRAAKAAYEQGNWDEYIQQMEAIQKAEPTAADIPYYIGEAYRLQGQCRQALNYYNESLKVSDQFAPGYVGLAQARLCSDPNADVSQLYDAAIDADPKFGPSYLARANFHLARRDAKSALKDLEQADKLLPNSALVQLAYAEAHLQAGDNVEGLAAARKANSIDQTLLPSYYFLGYADTLNGRFEEAIKPLQTYLIYEPEDGSAYALLGQAYAQTEDYEAAIAPLKQALKYDPNQVRSYIYLGTASLRTGDIDSAFDYYQRALDFFPDSFDANIGLTEAMYRKGTFGSAYLQAETSKSKANDDTQMALVLYWRALSQEGRNAFGDALDDWQALLAMPEDVMTPEMRLTAQEHIAELITATPTSKGGTKTPVPTKAPPSSTPTPKSSGGGTPTATFTPMVFGTLSQTPTVTKTP